MSAKPTLTSVRMGGHVRINMGASCEIYEMLSSFRVADQVLLKLVKINSYRRG